MPRVTQKDVAEKAGVARTTVTLALQNHPNVALETKQRILQIAKELGYKPDPFLAGLAAYRTSKRPPAFHGTLAWLVNSSNYNWKAVPHYEGYFDGACARASQRGYVLQEFHILPGKEGARKTASILQARNVTGILLCPLASSEMEFEFGWEKFSAITFGYTLSTPRLHTVASAHFLNTRRAFQILAARGYRRIGMVIDGEIDRRCGHNVYAAHLLEQAKAQMEIIPPLFDYDSHCASSLWMGRKVAEYIATHQLDALLTSDFHILERFQSVGLSAPEDIGVAAISLPKNDVFLSGIVEDCEQTGAIATDLLIGMMQRGEKGIPDVCTRTHLEGIWHEGQTLRACPA